MISSTFSEAIDLLNKWREENRWLGVRALLGGPERHDFWAKIGMVSVSEFRLDGEFAMVFVSMDSTSFEAGYMDGREIPPEVHALMSGGMEFCFAIRSKTVSVLLLGQPDQNR